MKVLITLLAVAVTVSGLQAQASRDMRRVWDRTRDAGEVPVETPPAEVPAEVVEPEVVTPPVPVEPVVVPEPEPEPVVVIEPPVVVVEPEPVVQVPSGPSEAELAAQVEVARDPRSFRGETYAFEFTEKGVLRRFTTASGRVLIDQFGAVNLQGSYLTPEGRRVWFYAGGVGNSTYTATVNKRAEGETVVFDVVTRHPRFTMEHTYRCLPHGVEVAVAFRPTNLSDSRGQLSALLPVQVFPAALTPGARSAAADGEVRFETGEGALVVRHDATVQRAGHTAPAPAGGAVAMVSETAVTFSFGDGPADQPQKLNLTLLLP